jgi:uncharacterized protein YjbI with pentapeptide repeats
MTGGSVRARWDTQDGRLLAEEVLARLVAGRPLDGLGLGEVGGRVDLRGLPAPAPRRLARFEAAGWFVEHLGDLVELQGVRLRGLDLSGAFLDSFRFTGCVIEDCVLDKARCHDWRAWDSHVEHTSFRGASLRGSVLGAWSLGKGNHFTNVDFTQADFRNSTPFTAVYVGCDFSGTKLDKTEFQRCGLARCRFAGVMNEVIFEGRVFSAENEDDPNFVEDVDMSGAVLRLVEFRGFNLEAVRLPDDPGLRVIKNYPCVLKAAVAALQDREDETARVLRAILTKPKRDLGHPLGLFNRDDFVVHGGEEMAVLADEVIRQAEQECKSLSS